MDEARRGESTRLGQESRQTFLQRDFDDSEDVARLLQHAGCGQQHRAGRGGGRLPPPSQSVALAEPMGWSGNELPLGTGGVQEAGNGGPKPSGVPEVSPKEIGNERVSGG